MSFYLGGFVGPGASSLKQRSNQLTEQLLERRAKQSASTQATGARRRRSCELRKKLKVKTSCNAGCSQSAVQVFHAERCKREGIKCMSKSAWEATRREWNNASEDVKTNYQRRVKVLRHQTHFSERATTSLQQPPSASDAAQTPANSSTCIIPLEGLPTPSGPPQSLLPWYGAPDSSPFDCTAQEKALNDRWEEAKQDTGSRIQYQTARSLNAALVEGSTTSQRFERAAEAFADLTAGSPPESRDMPQKVEYPKQCGPLCLNSCSCRVVPRRFRESLFWRVGGGGKQKKLKLHGLVTCGWFFISVGLLTQSMDQL